MLRVLNKTENNYSCSFCNTPKNNNTIKNNKFMGTQNPINLNYQTSAINISFKGYFPEAKLINEINNFVNLVNDKNVKKIAFISHANPDCDAIGSMIAGRNIIKEATGKTADVFVLNPLNKNAAFLDSSVDKVKSINTILNNQEILGSQTPHDKILEMFGIYDLVIVTDTRDKSLLDNILNETILKHAKKVVKIDHHLNTESANAEDYNFGDINIIDSTKESVAQIIMQLVKPFGLDPEKVNTEISNAIAAGLLADSGQFMHARSGKIFEDAAILQETSNLSKISNEINSLSFTEFDLFREIMSKVQFLEDKEIAYFIIKDKDGISTKNAVINALTQISKIRGVKYYFSVIEDAKEPNKISSSIRSNDKAVIQIAEKYNGGGHSHASGLSTKVESSESFAKNIIEELKKLKDS